MPQNDAAGRPIRTPAAVDLGTLVAIPFRRDAVGIEPSTLFAMHRAFEPLIVAVGEVVVLDVGFDAVVIRASAKACGALLALVAEAQVAAPVHSPLRLLVPLGPAVG